MWSVGVSIFCALAGYFPFQSTHPSKDLVTDNRRFQPKYSQETWSKISPEAKHLVQSLLQVDPSKRLTALEVLQHPWIVKYCPPLEVPLEQQFTCRKFLGRLRMSLEEAKEEAALNRVRLAATLALREPRRRSGEFSKSTAASPRLPSTAGMEQSVLESSVFARVCDSTAEPCGQLASPRHRGLWPTNEVDEGHHPRQASADVSDTSLWSSGSVGIGRPSERMSTQVMEKAYAVLSGSQTPHRGPSRASSPGVSPSPRSSLGLPAPKYTSFDQLSSLKALPVDSMLASSSKTPSMREGSIAVSGPPPSERAHGSSLVPPARQSAMYAAQDGGFIETDHGSASERSGGVPDVPLRFWDASSSSRVLPKAEKERRGMVIDGTPQTQGTSPFQEPQQIGGSHRNRSRRAGAPELVLVEPTGGRHNRLWESEGAQTTHRRMSDEEFIPCAEVVSLGMSVEPIASPRPMPATSVAGASDSKTPLSEVKRPLKPSVLTASPTFSRLSLTVPPLCLDVAQSSPTPLAILLASLPYNDFCASPQMRMASADDATAHSLNQSSGSSTHDPSSASSPRPGKGIRTALSAPSATLLQSLPSDASSVLSPTHTASSVPAPTLLASLPSDASPTSQRRKKVLSKPLVAQSLLPSTISNNPPATPSAIESASSTSASTLSAYINAHSLTSGSSYSGATGRMLLGTTSIDSYSSSFSSACPSPASTLNTPSPRDFPGSLSSPKRFLPTNKLGTKGSFPSPSKLKAESKPQVP
eukprot:TRINITY_DN1021_c1_g1_i1.p1 TRINITY_DN1021_c1_g1~~TRINITY_DN1021_c1_g1_i1.p1  ORF type:complete len:836 (-),score=92.58 TRINITY_DN1021_c1_g1_i1:619-2889(-)